MKRPKINEKFIRNGHLKNTGLWLRSNVAYPYLLGILDIR